MKQQRLFVHEDLPLFTTTDDNRLTVSRTATVASKLFVPYKVDVSKQTISYKDSDGNEIRFVPVENIPGYTHRIAYNGLGIDWLGEHNEPDERMAAFYIKKLKSSN